MSLSKPYLKQVPLPYHLSSIDGDEIREVVDTLRSGWLTTGPKTQRFEGDFKDYIGCHQAVGVNSCTAGLHLALAVSDLNEGDEVITTPMTFAATTNVLIHQRLKPVFVDVEPDTMIMDASKIEAKISAKTRCILPVHFAGHPFDIDSIKEIADRRNLKLIEDGAHATGAYYKEKRIGNHGNLTSFSFYANKNITTGEGGMLAVPNDEQAEKIRVLRLQGLSRDAWKRYGKEGYAHYELEAPGYKYNMADLNAALGIHQLKKSDSFMETRCRYAAMYDDAFNSLETVDVLQEKEYAHSAYHIYVLALNPAALTVDRDRFLNELQTLGIGVAVHYRAVHLQPYYQRTLKYKRGDLPIASSLSDRVLSIPLYPRMTENDVYRVIDTVTSLLDKFKK